jgi:hypothetical protein
MRRRSARIVAAEEEVAVVEGVVAVAAAATAKTAATVGSEGRHSHVTQ